MVNDDVERVRGALAHLCEPLHDAFTTANTLRRERLPELADDPKYRWHGTHTIRAFAHYALSQMDDLGPWVLSGNHSRNGELWLTDTQYRLRVLHTLSHKHVPPPGSNWQRSAFYRNVPLVHLQDPLFGPPNDRLLILWRIDGESDQPGFRVVRPIGHWSFGERAQVDLNFFLPATAADLADLTFEPTDDDMQLDIPNEGLEGGADSAGGISG